MKRINTLRRQDRNRWGSWILAFLLAIFLLSASYTGYLAYQTIRDYVRRAPSLPSLSTILTYHSAHTAMAYNNQTGPNPNRFVAPAQKSSANDQLQQMLSLPQWNRKERINILLLGVDQRPDEKGPSRTDTMIVLTIDLNSGRLGMVSITRDIWVHIPAYDISTKINTAYALGERKGYPGGGAVLVKKTISDLIGYPIHYYVMINFDGFQQIIDQIGGIDINVPYDIDDDKYPDNHYGIIHIHFNKGWQHMNGDRALKYARTRHQDSDYSRARRQQQVILAIRDKLLQRKMIPALMLKLPQMLSILRGAIQTDLPLDQMMALGETLQNSNLKQIDRLVLDNHYGTESYSEGGAWILVPNMAKIRTAIDKIFSKTKGTPTPEGTTRPALQRIAILEATATPDPLLTIRREKARIIIVDGSNRPGITAQLAQQLTILGLEVIQFGSEGQNNIKQSKLIVYHEKPATRAFLQQHLPPSAITSEEMKSSNSLLDFRLILGSDFQGLELTSP